MITCITHNRADDWVEDFYPYFDVLWAPFPIDLRFLLILEAFNNQSGNNYSTSLQERLQKILVFILIFFQIILISSSYVDIWWAIIKSTTIMHISFLLCVIMKYPQRQRFSIVAVLFERLIRYVQVVSTFLRFRLRFWYSFKSSQSSRFQKRWGI